MININLMKQEAFRNGYKGRYADAKVCQDIILKAIANSNLNRNVTIKGGVVMRGITNDSRRATLDIDMDFIKYSLSDESIDAFIRSLNNLQGITITRIGDIKELKQRDYHGKRVDVKIEDQFSNILISKIDLGVHTKLDIEQEEYCFDIEMDDEGASLLINTKEQIFTEKLKSLLIIGPFTTRSKDVFDMYYLSKRIDVEKLNDCLESYIYSDSTIKENNLDNILKRIHFIFKDKRFRKMLSSTNRNWVDVEIEVILSELELFIHQLQW